MHSPLHGRRRGGAPLKDPAEYRSVKLTVRLSPAEYSAATSCAREAGHAQLAPWLRELALRGGSPRRSVPLAYMQHYQELARTNANLNQLAHVINLQLKLGRDLDSFVIERLEALELVVKSLDEDLEKVRLSIIASD